MTQRSTSLPAGSPAISPTLQKSLSGPHELECRIQRDLQSHPALRFSRLTVHQCPQGICLEGLLESNEEGIDLCDLVRQIAPVKVINHVVMQPTKPK